MIFIILCISYNIISEICKCNQKRCLCYTHLRRAFVDALPKDIHNSEASKPAEAILRLNQLFNIESELEALPPDQKKKERLIREKPLLEVFWSWAEKSAIGELPKSKLSKAFHYALNNREGFWNYLEDGNCSISNSLAENCIRPFVIGRKNWLFSGSPKGAEASACTVHQTVIPCPICNLNVGKFPHNFIKHACKKRTDLRLSLPVHPPGCHIVTVSGF